MNIPYDRVHVPRVRRPDQTAVCRVHRHFNITTNIMVWFYGTFVSPGGIFKQSINQCTIIVHCMLLLSLAEHGSFSFRGSESDVAQTTGSGVRD